MYRLPPNNKISDYFPQLMPTLRHSGPHLQFPPVGGSLPKNKNIFLKNKIVVLYQNCQLQEQGVTAKTFSKTAFFSCSAFSEP
jgi:hypothetical protein